MEFPGSPVVRNLHSDCPGHDQGMDSIQGRNSECMWHSQKKEKKQPNAKAGRN